MRKHELKYQKTGYFSKLMCDYLEQKESLKSFYGNFPDLNGFKSQIALKKENFPVENRTVLVQDLTQQYQGFEVSETTKSNISSLLNENAFTIVTGHQLNLFTGPLYFLYKIVSTINLTKELKEKYPENDFVPVYWMATEDHDFDEINHFFYKGNKVSWNRKDGGAVGRFDTKGLEEVFSLLKTEMTSNRNAKYLQDLFEKAYLNHKTLADATRYMVNELFGEYGLVIVDGDRKNLKSLFVKTMQEDLINHTAFDKVSETNAELGKNYKIQVNPREINLFYLEENLRERIIEENGFYKINNSNLVFTKEAILEELNTNPEKFSPNVILRPVFQETILPNLCYIGGGGELAYWLELKSFFESQKLTFPILLLRNSGMIMTKKQYKKLENLNISIEEVFMKQDDLVNKKVKELSHPDLDFSDQIETLEKMFSEFEVLAEKTDSSFTGAVKAQKVKQLKGLKNLEKRLLKAQKKKLYDVVTRIQVLRGEMFPNQSLEERKRNMSEVIENFGPELIPILFENMKPLEQNFTILELE
ncbi:bacillithiol biosynthesis cysteine-adding enzyme BshC [Aureivirga sp. CE67]|uniref:bacillithiol biosynthesis cysteine-adding enzyme BshC n=1 Tax=Aureivirga sp. CE67 TaxID=1788983 RepID=UPI0018CA7F60|nr:bacillithiol biosynthesis cysteine-adding enzyme BshC [Aureivirga sp. CE67]